MLGMLPCPHCVAFICSNNAREKDPNISFHVEPGENRPEVGINGFTPSQTAN